MGRPGEQCFSCGAANHAAKDCPKRKERKVSKACLFCRQWGHVVSECPRAASASAAPAEPHPQVATGELGTGVAAGESERREQEDKSAMGTEGLGVGVCYNCGSTHHRLHNCPLPRANGMCSRLLELGFAAHAARRLPMLLVACKPLGGGGGEWMALHALNALPMIMRHSCASASPSTLVARTHC
ncbi:unnamed protein product [Closterium sp. Yama58-4]|nr:unnamed protein product [Closterium sp. Yama58-4]